MGVSAQGADFALTPVGCPRWRLLGAILLSGEWRAAQAASASLRLSSFNFRNRSARRAFRSSASNRIHSATLSWLSFDATVAFSRSLAHSKIQRPLSLGRPARWIVPSFGEHGSRFRLRFLRRI